MLNVSLTRIGTNSDGTIMYLRDSTIWASPEVREQHTLFLQVFLERASGPEEITDITKDVNYTDREYFDVVHNGIQVVHNGVDIISSALRSALTEYTVGLANDGYYNAYQVAVSVTQPVIEGAYGTSVDGELVQLVDGELVTKKPIDLVEDPEFIDWVSLKTLLLARLSIYTNDKYLEYFNESCKYFGDAGHYPELYELKRVLDHSKAAQAGSLYLWELGNYTGAQVIVENMEVLWT